MFRFMPVKTVCVQPVAHACFTRLALFRACTGQISVDAYRQDVNAPSAFWTATPTMY